MDKGATWFEGLGAIGFDYVDRIGAAPGREAYDRGAALRACPGRTATSTAH